MQAIETITALVSAYPYVAYGIVLVLALSESLPVLGAAIPGTAIIVGLSALVPSGVLKLYPLLASAAAGAIIGDGFAFWLGHRYRLEIAASWPFKKYPALIEKSQAFFHRHGGKSVFLARFTPGVRAFVPLVAGITQMPAVRFYAVNIISALVWAPSHILPGVFAGAFAASQGAAGTRLIALLIIFAAAAWLTLRLTRYAVLRAVPLVMSGVDALRDRARQADNLVSRLVLRLLGPTENELPVLALLIAIPVGAAWLFFGIAEDVITGDPLVTFDKSVFAFLQGIRTRAADAVMIGITELGDTTVVLAVSAAVLVLLAARRSWRTAGYFLGAVVGASIFNTAIKVAVHRVRPSPDLYAGWSNFSFPSGHSTENAALYGFIAFLVCRPLSNAGRMWVALPITMLIIAIAFSRVYLGAHWFSDVVAGLAFAVVWLTILIVAYLNHPSSKESTAGLLGVVGAALIVGGGLNIWHQHAADVERYGIRWEVRTVSKHDWMNAEWEALPARRLDIVGEYEEPFVIQYAGPLSGLIEQLEANGWRQGSVWNPSGLAEWLNPNPDIEKAATIPLLNRGNLPALIMIKKTGSPDFGRYVLRAWPTELALDTEPISPLWLVSAMEEKRHDVLFGLGFPEDSGGYDAVRKSVADDLDPRKVTEKVRAVTSGDWSGRVSLFSGS